MAKDFGEQMAEQTEQEHQWLIDDAPRVVLTDGKHLMVVAKLGENDYWCPESYRELEIPEGFVEETE